MNYPPLPKPFQALYDEIDKETIDCYSPQQMRAYLDADRALRAAATDDEIKDLEKAYALLFAENAKLRAALQGDPRE